MTIVASKSPQAGSTDGAMRMPATPGNAMSAGAAGSKLTTTTSLPSADSANAIAIWEPIESPSGRECEERMNRCRARIASAICRISGSLAAIVAFAAILVRRMNLVEKLVDPILAGHRVVVVKLQLGHPLQPQARADLPAQKRRGALDGLLAVLPCLLVAEHGVENASELDVRADLDAGNRDEPDAGIVHVAREQG